MKSNCNYNKIKLLHEVSHMIWSIRKNYIKDADKSKHPLCKKMYKELASDLEKHKKKLEDAIAGLANEGKLH